MMDIKNKEIRLELIARYLNAETSPAEEMMLMDYYGNNNRVDDDEQAFARMIRMEKMNVSLLSDEGVEEFDRIIGEAKQETKRIPLRWIGWASGIAATIALLFMMIPSSPQTSTLEIAQSIQQMMNLPKDDILSVTATPIDDYVWVKAELKDGSSKTFIMNKDQEKGTTTLLAIN